MSFVGLWQVDVEEHAWIRNLFGDLITHDVFDGNRQFVADGCILFDNYLHSRPLSYYRRFSGKHAFLFHLSDETYEGGYEAYRSFSGVFRNYRSMAFDPGRVFTVPLGYSALPLPTGDHPVTCERQYLWSFLGDAKKSSRPDMLKAFHRIEPRFLHITDDLDHPRPPLSLDEYQTMLFKSVFVPCPMGNVNLECWRIYEALECGAVPIVERRPTLDYFEGLLGTHPLPSFGNWRDAAAFVANIAAEPFALDALRVRCATWWKNYKVELQASIRQFVADAPSASSLEAVSRIQQVPGWHTIELLRHHSFAAARRRFVRQARRLFEERRLRSTVGR